MGTRGRDLWRGADVGMNVGGWSRGPENEREGIQGIGEERGGEAAKGMDDVRRELGRQRVAGEGWRGRGRAGAVIGEKGRLDVLVREQLDLFVLGRNLVLPPQGGLRVAHALYLE